MIESILRLIFGEKKEFCELLPHSWKYEIETNKLICACCETEQIAKLDHIDFFIPIPANTFVYCRKRSELKAIEIENYSGKN